MPRKVAEQIRRIAIKCQRLAARSTDRQVADELEGVSAELAESARTLDELFMRIEET